MTREDWRLIVDSAASGAWNMAVDEAILDSQVSLSGPPTLRLYSWKPAALSLGAHQPAAHDRGFLREQGIHLVRRPTGGLAVLHENELTYSICGTLRSTAFPGAVLESYLQIAEALVAALALLGVRAEISGRDAKADAPAAADLAACFGKTSSHEIRVAGRKLIGAAQVRRRGAFLQHGSIPLVADSVRLARVLGGGVGDPSTDLCRSLVRHADPGVLPDALTGALVEAFGRRFQASLRPGLLSGPERQSATLLYSWKYLSAEWTLNGRRPSGVP